VDDHYVRQVLSQAVDALATSPRPLQVRLASAGVTLAKLSEGDFSNPADRALFTSIGDTLTAAEPITDEGSITATTKAMNDEQAVAAANQIIELHGKFFPIR
jgi:replicative DNA helicase